MSTCRESALRAPRSTGRERERERECQPASIKQSPSWIWVSARDSGARCIPAWALPRNRAAAVQLGPRAPARRAPGSHSAPGSGRGIQHGPQHLGYCHGESTICCEALPQLPAASPRASLERRLSGRGAGPSAGTTSRPRASPPPSTSPSSPLSLSPL